ncbi:hypothetical protein ACM46_17730 [Chryseobacterium angstadtii]|uniref:LysM domain-containing protein n=1 Tax=Chryseobacterium angstadtii TaxID=558151 RepID=A0A0J7I2R0_9FLAO|nr:LysM peptidoglycan-binding domain-containing protein [Chryseobacterium angstadtii]KMQ60086.1 hypothetical protein ACM46_17730 [Chryseobacterium angstadtii]
MEMDFFEYKIRNGDTLQSISSRLGMTSEELKLFHNTRCNKMDTLWFENLNGAQYILVPGNFKTEQQKESENKNILPPSCVHESFFLPAYHIRETFENLLKDTFVIDYSVEIDIHREKNDNHYVLKLRKKDFKTNGQTPDDKAGSLSLACMESIMPIELILSDNGNIARFAHHATMIKKFKETRKDLEEFFMGKISEMYFNAFQDYISDKEYFFYQLRSTLLFQTLFPKMDWFRKTSVWSEDFYFIQNSFPVQCSMETGYRDEDQDFIITILKGKITDSCSLQELKRGVKLGVTAEEPVSGEISFQYTTHKRSKHLSRAESSLSLWHENVQIQKHTVTITQ